MIKHATLFLLSVTFFSACNNSTNENPVLDEDQQVITSISLAPHLTELIYSAGGESGLLGVSAYSDYPEDALDKQIIGDAFHLNLELISQLDPDVIFYWHNGTPAQTIEQLKSMGFELVNIDITRLSDIPEGIKKIATTLNTQMVGAVDDFYPQLKQLKQQAASGQSALIQISDQPIFTVSGQHWMSEAIEICGLNNVFHDLASLSAAVTLEAVVLTEPAVIIRLESMGDNNPLRQWTSIPAIANNHIAMLNADHFTRPTLRTLTAIQSLCEQLDGF